MDKLKKVLIANSVVLLIALVTASVFIGQLYERVGYIDPAHIKQRIDKAVNEITEEYRQSMKKTEQTVEAFHKMQWCDMKSVRKSNETYTNRTSFPIQLAVTTEMRPPYRGANFCSLKLLVNGEVLAWPMNNENNMHTKCSAFATIPQGATYRVEANREGPTEDIGAIYLWWELRGSLGSNGEACRE